MYKKRSEIDLFFTWLRLYPFRSLLIGDTYWTRWDIPMEKVQSKQKENTKKVKFSSKFYSSIEWQTVREMAIRRDLYLCQDCLKKHMITPADEVHHIIKLTPDNINDPEIALNLDNLVSLCKDCHAARHSRPKRYTVDEFGRVEVR